MLPDKQVDRDFPALDSLIRELSGEKNRRRALDTGVLLANEVMRLCGAPVDALREGEDALDRVIPAASFPNQKAAAWFEKHPYMGGERVALRHVAEKDALYESKFYWLNSSATKARISAGVMLSFPNPNWEDSDLTAKPSYKVGVDFFLLPRARSLLLVVSRRGNLRVMELSERLTNTQHDIFSRIAGVFAKPAQAEIHQTLWDAFELRELNEKFYRGIAEHFERLVDHLKGNRHPPEDAKQFTARLLGRLLFVWFLRKKDMIDTTIDYFNTDNREAAEYYKHTLQPLFFETLNTPVRTRRPLPVRAGHAMPQQIDLNTPYLNGGLFEAKGNDWTDTAIEFPADWFVTLYRHFNGFNFTTDESSPQYEQVAIDPEMLGRVFESLLASQFTETGEQVRKSTGAFYTPREIVAYMCRESLRQYLYTALGNSAWNAGVDKLLDSSDSEYITAHTNAKRDLWGEANRETVPPKILAALERIAILDPACGSGAFPMGMLQLLLSLYERLDPDFNAHRKKLDIIQNNLYGVDIEEMAVEIARLRAWLSIIVDEEDVRKVKPLPNLDFKIVQGNSLTGVEIDLFNADKLFQLEGMKEHFFYTSNGVEKVALKRAIDAILRELSKEGKFDFKVWFSEVFKEQRQTANPLLLEDVTELSLTKEVREGGGFDIVLGNPPYGATYPAEHKKVFREQYKSAQTISGIQKGSLDTFSLFIERGFNLLRQGGGLDFIVPLSVVSSDAMTGLHRILLGNCETIRVSSYCDRPLQIFKNAHKKTSIISFVKTGTPCKSLLTTKMYRWHLHISLKDLIANLHFINGLPYILTGRFPKISLSVETAILDKLFTNSNIAISKLITRKGDPIYYRAAGGMYFNVVTNYSSGSTQEKPLVFEKKFANSIGAILSSSLFWWYQQVYSDNLHIKAPEIESFAIPVTNLTPEVSKEIEKVYALYLADIEKNAIVHQSTAYTVDSFKEYKIRKSKRFVDQIDDLVCPLYGLTEEETAFIKGYEIEFRMEEE